ncbi:aromatic ring-hydroxylating oxygenase subunit alpha [Planctomicrobium piriforme]|uniref:Phenylpropionate dioxygenase, large terminal subunit n=1 Tax=Planctomicrobium piriforme TaxID=1576369 RepID=A0A1I3DBF1_9PLAN|nr:aromatic ring-hydroxylating dioxygenase subunit alpha [Planctomicrobium piriforme]SFH84072.1 Phenylpropionate dioxygenase, large terminal subunit [Planctomicrobium piriforme]
MYQTPVALEPPLPPQAYCDAEFAERERQQVFLPAWHLVTTHSAVAKHGEFVALEVLGVPVVVRNFDGELVALRNVCAHRQSIIARKPSGCSPTLKCPYHGWEYGSDGKTRKLPGATNFPKFKHDEYCLDKFLVEQCGDLVFIRLSETGPSLREWFGERFDLFAGWFSTGKYAQSMSCRFDMAANWKIPVEGSLESYHIPCVHPQTFHEDPGEKPSTHFFYPTGTAFQTIFLAPRWIDSRLRDVERIVLGILGIRYTGDYDHHHVFPHLLISHTDSLSVAQVVIPVDATHCYTLAMQYGIEPVKPNFFSTRVARRWGKFTAWLTRTILAEDRDIFPAVQAGVQGARKPGILGRCEERLHALQKYVHDRVHGIVVTQVVEPTTLPSDSPLQAPCLSEVAHD